MKRAPVSGDLLVKLAIAAAGLGLVLYLVNRARAAAGDLVGQVADDLAQVADSVIVGVNPTNPDNWVNQAASAAGGALVSDTGPGRSADGSWSVGAWIYDVTHADPVGQTVFPAKQASIFGSNSEELTMYSSSMGLAP